MKFSEKYELLESLTTGAIETFAAHDRVRDERVLVHIVDCAPQKPDQTTAEWVLESFRKLAPEPPGPVLETGKYSGTKYAYVVTKLADETLVKSWVRRYELQAQETKETKAHALRTEVGDCAVLPATPPPAPKEPQASGSMTQLFRDYDSLTKSKAQEPAVRQETPAVRPAASTSLPGESGLHIAEPWDASNAKASDITKQPPLPPPPPQKAYIPEPPPSLARDSAKPGEFTNFFQGPFRGDGSADMPAVSSRPMEPPKKSVGEFTALFGQSSSPPAATPAPSNVSEQSFTGMFKDMATPQPRFDEPVPVQGGVIPPAQPLPSASPVNVTPLPDPVFIAPAAPAVSLVTPAPPIPALPSVPAEKPVPARPASLHGEGATGPFVQPAVEPIPVPVEAPRGPSPYTQIISRPKFEACEESEAGQAPAPGASPGKFAAPSMPKIAAPAPPPTPKVPAPPRLAPPPMPKAKAPQVPKAPKIDAPPPPPISMLPLIITLTVLFVLAVILVLYFVLRH